MRTRNHVLFLAAFVTLACTGGHSPGEPGAESHAAPVPPPTAALAASLETASADASLAGLPWLERVALEQALAASDERFAPRLDEGGLVLETPGSVVATFTARGAHLRLGGHETTLRAVALGRAGAIRSLDGSGTPVVAGAEVRTARGVGVVEWWRSLPSGLEHGVTIAERPRGDGELAVEIAVDGLSARLLSDDAVELADAAGVRVATYAHLFVLDAGGGRVPAHMAINGARIVLWIDDERARYPLVVDPIVTSEEATLLAPDGFGNDYFGHSVAFSSDASRALVGVREDDTVGGLNAGSARVFLRTGTAWAQEATLLAPDGAPGDAFGHTVALSSDGSRALVGAVYDDTAGGTDAGSVRVFLRTGTSWAQETTLVAPDGAMDDYFGHAVALSSDASRAFVAVSSDTTGGGVGAGSVRVFLRTGTAWAQEATLVAPDGAPSDTFGQSVAASSDGSRALVGVTADDTGGGTDAGSARVFLRTGTSWAEEATLLAPDGASFDGLGSSVALASDASRALVGVRYDDTPMLNAGSARVFVRTGTSWAQEVVLVAPDGGSADIFGTSVALSSDGSRAVVGANGDDTTNGLDSGSARLFLRTGATWTQEATLLASAGEVGDALGWSVALSSDGSRALCSVHLDDTAGRGDAGTARVFLLLGSNGTPCSGDGACTSGFCTDGVCCGTRCAGGTSDCQACSMALTGGVDGTCAAHSAAVAPTVTCRASAGVCDVADTCTSTSTACPSDGFAASVVVCRAPLQACDAAERCTGTSATCPADLLSGAGTICRAPAPGGCDVAEVCSGASAACPADGFASAAAVCRAVAGACDVEERCNGASVTCPGDVVVPTSTTCRAATTAGCDVAEVCNGASPVCPGDGFAGTGTVCRGVSDACDVEEVCTGASAACPANAVQSSGFVCRAPTSACDLPEVCTGASAACPADLFAPATTTCGPTPSGICDAMDRCSGTSSACIDTYLSGVECRAASGPCDVAETCLGSAPTCPTDAFLVAGLVCRPVGGACDIEETCTGASPACPTNAVYPSSVVCRAPSSACDVAESCTGALVTCPADLFQPATTTCGPAPSGVCDAADRCAGTSAACIDTYLSGVECRPAAGACDIPESCSGFVTACPSDVLVSAGVGCGGTTIGSCSSAGTCDGALPACPGATPFPAGTVCLPAAAGNPCDLDDECDGVSDACQPVYAASTTMCDPTISGVCDAPDFCAGTSANCVPGYVSGVECRSAGGVCDAPEFCAGTSASCPPDAVESAGISCRVSLDPACDPEEMCDGLSASCPLDVSTCGADAGPSDAGASPRDSGASTDVGPPADVGPLADTGAAPVALAGCQCRLAPARTPASALCGVALALAALSRRRSRHRHR